VNETGVTKESYAYDIRLDFFSGPMDLLLHLVSLKEVSIEEVSMTEVLDQYLDIVTRHAHEIDLEKASDYLVIVATLMVLKSKALLPPEPLSDDTQDEENEYSRFFESLRERLKAFELTRARALALVESPQLGVDTFVRNDKNAIKIPPEMIAEGESSIRLGTLFMNLVKRVGGLGRSITISIEPVSIVSSMMKVVDALTTFFPKGKESFYSIIKKCYKKNELKTPETSRNIIMGSFVALLELAKRGVLEVTQENQSSEIFVTLRAGMNSNDAASNEADIFESEFDGSNNNVISMESFKNDTPVSSSIDNFDNDFDNDVKDKVING
jgi:segregation and condensation protein A